MSTAVALPTNMALPAHLQTPEAAAQIAAMNAAAAGGIKVGGFPRISIEGGKFHEIDAAIDGGNPRTYMVAAQPGQPPLPMMCLEAVVIAANPALVKTYYAGKWVRGSAEAPDCQSTNGIVPDASVLVPQAPVCATCPNNEWGSKISEATGKPVKACTDSKQMVVLPGSDLSYKALGLNVTPAALGNWGKYVKALSDRNIPVNSVVTNITFDHTAAYPKLEFAYNRFLTPDEYTQALTRAAGDDVKTIITPPRVAAPALPPPATVGLPPSTQPLVSPPVAAAPLPAQPIPAPVYTPPPAPAPTPAAPVQAPPAQPPAPAGFGAAMTAATPAATSTPVSTGGIVTAPVPAEPPKRTRRTRAQMAADAARPDGSPPAPGPAFVPGAAPNGLGVPPPVAALDLSHIPEAIRNTILAVGTEFPAGLALRAQYPFIPVATPLPTSTVPASTLQTTAPVAIPAAVAPVATAPVFVAPPPVAVATTPSGFGVTTATAAVPAPVQAPGAGVIASAMSLKALLEKKLGINQPGATPPAA